MSDIACCACLSVVYKPIENSNGTLTERWVCANSDDHVFVRRGRIGESHADTALALAGITPEALARDPECVKKLVESSTALTEHIGRLARDYKIEALLMDVRAAVRACGIEST